MLDLNLLRLNDYIIAFSFNIHFDGVLHQVYAGESSRFVEFDHASLLTLRMLQDSSARKDRHIYLHMPDDACKNHWASQPVELVRYRHCATRPFAARLLQFGQWLKSGVGADAPFNAHS